MNEIWVWTIGEMTFTRENLSTNRKTCPVPLPPPHIKYWLAWHQNPGIYGQRPVTNHLRDGMACWASECEQYNINVKTADRPHNLKL